MVQNLIFNLMAAGIPGVTSSPFFKGGEAEVIELHTKVQKAGALLFAFMVVFSLLFSLVGLMAKMEISPRELMLRGLLVVALFGGHFYIMDVVLKVGDGIGDTIVSDDLLKEFVSTMEKKATNEPGGAKTSWSEWLGTLFSILSTTSVVSVGLSQMVNALSTLLFIIGFVLMNILWVVLVVILYVFSPILIALGLVPKWGNKILSNWIGAIVQLSAWQIWMKICTWLYTTGIKIFIAPVSSNDFDVASGANMTQAAVLGLLGAGLFFATPVIINAVLPISQFSSYGGLGYEMAMSRIAWATEKAGQAGGMIPGIGPGISAGSQAAAAGIRQAGSVGDPHGRGTIGGGGIGAMKQSFGGGDGSEGGTSGGSGGGGTPSSGGGSPSSGGGGGMGGGAPSGGSAPAVP
jgi:hypothetical protein